jgi:hypothetical protein
VIPCSSWDGCRIVEILQYIHQLRRGGATMSVVMTPTYPFFRCCTMSDSDGHSLHPHAPVVTYATYLLHGTISAREIGCGMRHCLPMSMRPTNRQGLLSPTPVDRAPTPFLCAVKVYVAGGNGGKCYKTSDARHLQLQQTFFITFNFLRLVLNLPFDFQYSSP